MSSETSSLTAIARKIATHVITTRASTSHAIRKLPLDEIADLIDGVTEILRTEPGCLELADERCVVGDIHGNIDDLMRIFEISGYPPLRSYLFLGDYVDRGLHSCEVILLLYSLKALYPTHVSFLRGNHEFEIMNESYGFKRECIANLSPEIYAKIIASFEELPIAAILFHTFCVHGGISPSLQSREDVLAISKKCAEFGDNLQSDLLWSDPSSDTDEYIPNPRGCGRLFGVDAVLDFVEDIGRCTQVIRAHESCQKGFNFPFAEPLVMTVFSCCDYCEMGNDAAVAIVTKDEEPQIIQIEPIIEGKAFRRRPIYPEWALDQGMGMMRPEMEEWDDALEVMIDV